MDIDDLRAGPFKQPIPKTLYSLCCEAKMERRGGYLMGGWSDWVGFICQKCHKIWFWQPDKDYEAK